jgi:hypothetical protein
VVELPIDVLWLFREFKRDEVAAPNVPYAQNHTLEEMAAHIESSKKIDPLELSIIGTKALLTDGNHRLVVAKRLGYTMVPVNIIVLFGEGDDTFYEHTLKRFKPITAALEFWLKKTFL